jgi:DNA-binding protein YbaB
MSTAMDAVEARLHQQIDRMHELSEQIAAIRVRETSPDREVTAEVDGNGRLLDLSFEHSIGNLSPANFEKLLVATAGMAAQRAFARRGELVTEFNAQAIETSPGIHSGR